jgi:uncharacterized protein YpbB
MKRGSSFKGIKNMQQQQASIPVVCKNTYGIIITQLNEVLKRWKDHFSKIVNKNNSVNLDARGTWNK